MRLGVDYSFDPPTPAELRAAGATFVVRYVGVPGHAKNLTATEAAALSSAGLDLVAVYQPSDGFMFQVGRDGRRDAELAWADASRCGMPAGRPVYFALDVDPTLLTSDDWTRVRTFLDRAASYLGPDRVRTYGGLGMVERAGAWGYEPNWQTRSWSTVDGQLTWSRHAGLRQVRHEVTLGSGKVDWNEAHVEDFGQWRVRGGNVAPERYPGALWRPLQGEEQNEPTIRATQFIAHTMVGFVKTTEDLFDQEGNPIESHFGLGGPWDEGRGGHDGEGWQWMPLNRSADANRTANRRPDGTGAISVETSDGGNPSRAWSPAQLAWLVRFGNWACDNLGIPRRVCRDPDDPGLGYHSMWIGTRWMAADRTTPWSTVAGKTCPGDGGSAAGTTGPRITQWKTIVVPAILAGRNLEGDVEVTSFSNEARDVLRAEAREGSQDTLRTAVGTGPDDPAGDYFRGLAATVGRIEENLSLLSGPVPVAVDAAAVAAFLRTDMEFLAAVAKAVNDDAHRRSAE